ncbi:MAG: 50S ribosomal protein L19, partial [Candidatus Colwellbacteria bacterium CG10_big_fil_rev_8_21_14_0_10_41_28]
MLDKETIAQIKPGIRVRIQDKNGMFEGIVISRKHGKEAGATFTVRGEVASVGVEKV